MTNIMQDRTLKQIYFHFLDECEPNEKQPFHGRNVFKHEVRIVINQTDSEIICLLMSSFTSVYKKDDVGSLWFHVDLW